MMRSAYAVITDLAKATQVSPGWEDMHRFATPFVGRHQPASIFGMAYHS